MIKILFICHGNICRSPMAEFVLKDMVEKRGIKDLFEIESAATSSEEIWGGIGNPVYPPAQAVLRAHGIGKTAYTDFSKKRARKLTAADYDRYDHLIGMDSANMRNISRITGHDESEGKIVKLLDLTELKRDVSDPWYTDRFEEAYRDVKRGCEALLKLLGFCKNDCAR